MPGRVPKVRVGEVLRQGTMTLSGQVTVPSGRVAVGPVPVTTSLSTGSPTAEVSICCTVRASERAPFSIWEVPDITSTAAHRPPGKVSVA